MNYFFAMLSSSPFSAAVVMMAEVIQEEGILVFLVNIGVKLLIIRVQGSKAL